MAWTFERIVRDCPHNAKLKSAGATRGLLYDFKVLCDGNHVALWSQYGVNGSTDTRGFRYWLKDKTGKAVNNGDSRGGHPVAARNREEFESVLIANFHRVPTDDELAQRKAEDDTKEADRKTAEEARHKIYLAEEAAPELLWALQRIIEDLPINRNWLDPNLERLAKKAIAKAKGVTA